ncbi:MAG: RNA polymerase sigma factor [Pirellulaceae bacterium]|nr:RNA polymerase sigma factor [Pirellulaceae bacterium]
MNSHDFDFQETLETYWDTIYQLGLRMLGNATEAEEMAQQTFFKAYLAWDQFQGRSQIKTWLFRIGINVCRKQLQDRNRFQGCDLDPQWSAADPDKNHSQEELKDRVQAALACLEPKHRLILTLFCIDGLRHLEIANILNVPEGTVWSRLHTAKKKLAQKLQNLPQETLP